MASVLCLWGYDVCLPQAKFHDNKYISKQLPDFGLRLTNIRKELLFLIRTDIGLFFMQMITSNSTWSHNSTKDWSWLYGVARKHPSLNVGEKILLHSAAFLEWWLLNFKMMCELNIFIKLKIKGFGSLERCSSIKNCWLNF